MQHSHETLDIYRRCKALSTDLGRFQTKTNLLCGGYHMWTFTQPHGTIDFGFDTWTERVFVWVQLADLSPGIQVFSATPEDVEIDKTDDLVLNWPRLWKKISAHLKQQRAA